MTTTSSSGHAGARAREAAALGADIRDRIRDITVHAFRDRKLTMRELSGLVDEVLEGASDGIRASIPGSKTSALHQVFDGVSDAVETIASAGGKAAREVREHAQEIIEKDLSAAARHARSANEEFLGAVNRFAKRATGEVREELDKLVARARRTGRQVGKSAREAAEAADGHLLEITGDAARAGVTAARRAAGGLAMAAGGLLEGVAAAISPREKRPAARAPKRKTAKKKGAKKKSGKKRTGTKKTAGKKRSSKRLS